ncbi:alpha-ketoacid dehydrogenase kinase N-terminal domain-containing protein [Crepidotus variabilis]|uniref:Protein-serine/threonine kinase n=1 Tax=Crepidotus variabilis TaxID=179855 RepID=A0A9P6ERX7_9AGAR|nr:alpha-ketoacid dehydrogenase kinase N-terminal domain-containing protein [Crepidotus variabilis]
MLKIGCSYRTLFSASNGTITHRSVNSTRHQSTALHFYQNKQLELYASKQASRLTLRQLVFFGRKMNEDRLMKSANYVRTELPVRIAHRLRDLQALPFIVVTQEGVGRVYELYWSAFEKLRRYPPITTLDENEKFCEFLGGLLNEHAPVIPNITLGLSLASPHLPPESLDSFMRRMLVSRISRRVLAEHHIALSEGFVGRGQRTDGEPHVGIIFTGLNVKRSVERCARLLRESPIWIYDEENLPDPSCWPEVHVEGHVNTSFAYIREHLEYIIFELLKNSMHATYAHHHKEKTLPAVQVTIVAGEHDVGIRISDQGGGLRTARNRVKNPADLFSFSHLRNEARLDDSRLGALRSASSQQAGFVGTVDEQVGRWQKARKQESTGLITDGAAIQQTHPRIGIGLPMSNIYTTYFGGSLDLISLDGWGTDVYLRLPKLGKNLEGIEV